MAQIGNRETKKLLITLAVVFAVILTTANVMQTGLVRRQRRADQQMFAIFLGNVCARYPEVREEEWIAFLNETDNQEAGRELLRRYGIFEGRETFRVQERYFRNFRFLLNGGLVLLFGGMGLGIFLYLRKRQRRMDELSGYLRRVAHGEYMLELEKQGEDELSFLQNELYKVIVLLREQAEGMRSQKAALAQSVSDISHQLKTPLTSAMVLVDNLMENGGMEEVTRRHFLAEITAQLSGMAWLVAVMLKIARFDAGVVELEKEDVPLLPLLEQVLEGLEQQAEWREVSLCLRQEAKKIVVRGDAKWLKEAFSNIVKNAIEHSEAKGDVNLSVQDNEVYTAVSIRNFGAPIDEEEQKHIFDRFYQKKNPEVSSQERRLGMENAGIGLALAKEIVERQNGMITLESTKEEGTVFTVKFLKVGM